jgi:predicted nuclease with TOPRIM domain
VGLELRKHYEQAKERTEKLIKERSQMEAQMKKLLSQFLIQRQAL